jgi:hypothetical protein
VFYFDKHWCIIKILIRLQGILQAAYAALWMMYCVGIDQFMQALSTKT